MKSYRVLLNTDVNAGLTDSLVEFERVLQLHVMRVVQSIDSYLFKVGGT